MINILTKRLFLPAIVFTLAVLLPADAALTLAAKGKSEAFIVSSTHEKPAKVLQEYLEKITGTKIPIVSRETELKLDQTAIVLQVVGTVTGASTRPTAKQAYHLYSVGNRLYLNGGSELGLLYAVYGFLEDHLGVRFYNFKSVRLSYAGPGFEIIPSEKTLKIGEIYETHEPAFPIRGFIYYIPIDEWLLKNRGGGLPANSIWANHNFYQLIPPKKHFKDHPDWYPLRNGKRQHDWSMGLCGTNKELAQEMANALMEIMEKAKNPDKPISAAQGDGFTGCQCDECRALVMKEETEAAPIILMLNRALDITAQKYPKHRVITFAYFDTLPAPQTLRPHPNLWINVVSSSLSQNAAGDQVGPIPDNPSNRDYAKALQDWPKIAPGRVMVWHWSALAHFTEWPDIYSLPDDLRFLQKCGVAGPHLQVGWGSLNWAWLRNWLFLKLAWNPQADADKLIKQFVTDYYGKKAAPHILKCLQLSYDAYQQSGFAPSGVRWTGWPSTMRLKMYPPDILSKMDNLLAGAQKAASKEKDSIYAKHALHARGTTVDHMILDGAKATEPFRPTTKFFQGRRWVVAGGRKDLPERISRIVEVLAIGDLGAHGALRETSWFVAKHGGPISWLWNDELDVHVVPNLSGQVTSIRHQATGKELLASDGLEFGYRDIFEGISSQIWSVEEKNDSKIRTKLILSPKYWGWTTNNTLHRTITTDKDGAGVTVARRYEQLKGGGLKNPTRFSNRWQLHLPDPSVARAAVRGGGIAKMLDLRYAEPGGIRGVRAGEKLPGNDFMDERIDDVIAVSDAQVTELPITKAEGELLIQLDRGDGLVVSLKTSASGWEAVKLQPVVEKHRLTITLIAKPQAMDQAAKTIDLPAQTLSAQTTEPAAEREKSEVAGSGEPAAKPSIRITGEGRAVNDKDGAELFWIPAGKFLRGSKKGRGGSDEWPQRKIHLTGYWIYKHPISLKQYAAFCKATGKKMPPAPWGQKMRSDPAALKDSYPVLVSWHDAEAYARWAGGVLPTEAQWEKAARGKDGRQYPWGDEWDRAKAAGMERTIYKFKPGSLPVGSSPEGASPYGIEDMSGNVWEWVSDWYEHRYYSRSPSSNPTGPKTGTHKVLRGGDSLWDERFSRCAARFLCPPHVRDWVKTGFRCVLADAESTL